MPLGPLPSARAQTITEGEGSHDDCAELWGLLCLCQGQCWELWGLVSDLPLPAQVPG